MDITVDSFTSLTRQHLDFNNRFLSFSDTAEAWIIDKNQSIKAFLSPASHNSVCPLSRFCSLNFFFLLSFLVIQPLLFPCVLSLPPLSLLLLSASPLVICFFSFFHLLLLFLLCLLLFFLFLRLCCSSSLMTLLLLCLHLVSVSTKT